jgi:two-component system chemotaxis response regulator CheY
MPDMDGVEVLKQIRAIEKTKGISSRQKTKVIMVTSLDTPKDKLKAFGSDCDAYVVKPIDRHELLTTAQKLGLSAKQGGKTRVA